MCARDLPRTPARPLQHAARKKGRPTMGKSRSRIALLRAAGITAALIVAGTIALSARAAWADGPAPAAAPPDLATRVADLEAYITNGTPKALSSPGQIGR